MSYALEIDMIAKSAREKDMLTTPYVFSEAESRGGWRSPAPTSSSVTSGLTTGGFHRRSDGAEAGRLPGTYRHLGLRRR